MLAALLKTTEGTERLKQDTVKKHHFGLTKWNRNCTFLKLLHTDFRYLGWSSLLGGLHEGKEQCKGNVIMTVELQFECVNSIYMYMYNAFSTCHLHVRNCLCGDYSSFRYMYIGNRKVLGSNPSWILIFQVLTGNDLALMFKFV